MWIECLINDWTWKIRRQRELCQCVLRFASSSAPRRRCQWPARLTTNVKGASDVTHVVYVVLIPDLRVVKGTERSTSNRPRLSLPKQCVDIIKWLTYFSVFTQHRNHVHGDDMYITSSSFSLNGIRHIKIWVCKTDRRKAKKSQLFFLLFSFPFPWRPPTHTRSLFAIDCRKITLMMLSTRGGEWSEGGFWRMSTKEEKKCGTRKKKSFLPFTDKIYIRLIHECVYIILTQLSSLRLFSEVLFQPLPPEKMRVWGGKYEKSLSLFAPRRETWKGCRICSLEEKRPKGSQRLVCT